MRGRTQERAVLDGLLRRAREGLSGVLVLRGDAGYGKTTLLRYARDTAESWAADGLTVTEVSGVEAERELGYAALHRLLQPFLSDLSALPGPQRTALQAAFGLADAPAADRFLVSLSTLTLLSEQAAGRGLVILCDDAQWLDQESLEVLAFVARRLIADGIVMLFALREADGDRGGAAGPLDGLPDLTVRGLSRSDAWALLAEQAGTALDRVVAELIVAESDGNPLAIGELARAVATGEMLFGGEAARLDRRIEARFRNRVRALEPLAQTVLTVAACDGSGSIAVLRRAAAGLTGRPSDEVDAAIAGAEREALITVSTAGRVTFRHPLIRSAVVSGTVHTDRRAAHAALAAATDLDDAAAAGGDQPAARPRPPAGQAASAVPAGPAATAAADRRVWHLASAADGPDAAVADELAQRSESARSRGGHLAQAAMLHRAAELTPDPLTRDVRLLMACGAALLGGAPYRGEQLLDLMNPDAGVPLLAAQATRLRGLINVMVSRPGAVALLLEAARALEPVDPRAAREACLEAVDAVAVVPQIGGGLEELQAVVAALSIPTGRDAETGELLLNAYTALITSGYVQAVPQLTRAVAAMSEEGAEYAGAARWILISLIAAVDLWDLETLRACADRYARAAREQGTLRMLQVALAGQAMHALFVGDFELARELYAEFADVAEAVGANLHYAHATDMLLLAWRGDTDQTYAKALVHLGPHTEPPGGLQVQLARVAVAVLEIGHRRYPEAQAAAEAVYTEDPPFLGGLALPDLIEAAVRNDDLATATAALARLTERATATGTAWARGLLARSRALLATDPAEAETFFAEALHHLEPTRLNSESARTHLLYGEWLRRERRRQEARHQLRTAHAMFTAMGAEAFAERTRLELAATGELVRTQIPASAFGLTAQEARVARMAASGATNSEIATALFLSPSTIEYHLRKVFRKTGVTTRRKLSAVVGGQESRGFGAGG